MFIRIIAVCLLVVLGVAPAAAANPFDLAQYIKSSDVSYSNASSWPLSVLCTGSDVNLREAPNTSCTVVGSLQKDEQVYLREISSAPEFDGYPWAAIITAQGQKGCVNSKYLQVVPGAAERRERFRALFYSSVFFKMGELSAANDNIHGNGFASITKEEKNMVGYDDVDSKVIINDLIWVYTSKEAGDIELYAAKLFAPGYKAAGLGVGDSFDAEAFSKDMSSIGWEEDMKSSDEYRWYSRALVDGHKRPVKGFVVKLKDGKITEVIWRLYLID